MTPTTKTPPRLLEAAKEFNIGRETLVAFLTDKGFEINSSPAFKLTEPMYKAAQVQFDKDKLAKSKSDQITLPKGSQFDSQRRNKDGANHNKDKKDDAHAAPKPTPATVVAPTPAPTPTPAVVAPVPVAKPASVPAAQPVDKPAPIPVAAPVVVAAPAPVVAAPVIAPAPKPVQPVLPIAEAPAKAPIAAAPVAATPQPVVKEAKAIPEKPAEQPKIKEETPKIVAEVKPIPNVEAKPKVQETEKLPVAEKQDKPAAQQHTPKPTPDAKEKPHTDTVKLPTADKAATPTKKTETPPVAVPEKKAEPVELEHLEIKAPKIEGPNILGKINLDELNLASRPKKGAGKKKDDKNSHAKKDGKKDGKAHTTTHAKTTHAKPHDTHAKPKTETPVKPAIKFILPIVEAPVVREEEVPVKPEHIEMKAPKLEGPKIIGKIELPVSQPSGNTRPDNRDRSEKRKRKRIPVDKKPDGNRADHHGGNRDRDNKGAGDKDNRDRNRGQNNANRNQPNNRGTGGAGTAGHGTSGENRDRDRPRQGGNTTHGGHGSNQGGGVGRPIGSGQGQHRGGQGQGNTGRQDTRRPAASGGANTERRSYNTPLSAQQQEIDTKAIQDKIKETQAKLTGSTRSKNLKAKYRRNKRDEMAEKRAAAENSETPNVVQVTEFISVSELASLLNVSFADVISKCMGLGIMVSINQRLDAEVIELVSSEFGYNVEFINLEQNIEEEEEIIDSEEDLQPRAPIVTIMGHVDHGKTSLLDYIRSANVVAGEAGGITQHIGAYQVTTSTGKKVTFLDTPGHEAFTAMRARGAKVADVAVIVIAADDAIMPQTKEAISHAQAANLPMIFAINKIDKPGAAPEKIKEQLAQMNILVEDWGGKYQCQEISAKKGTNIDVLLEKIGLEADLLDLKANPDRIAAGSVIEASLDKGRGYQSTILVQNGTLNQGDMIACGQHFGKIKAMFNERGQRVKVAGPSMPVQVLGLNGAPQAGEKFRVFVNEDEAKEVANHRAQIMREQGIRARKHITLDEIGRRLALGNFKELGVIIKGDFDGSVEALSDSLQKLSTEEVSVNVVHKGVGQITESDVLLATASDAIIIGFQVRPSIQAGKLAAQENIEIRTYSIIYDAIDEIKSAMEGLLEPKIEKRTIATIEVREIYKISGVGTIAGCYVTEGKMTRQTKLNLVRDGIVVFTGELASLKRFKDDVKDVNFGYECGLSIKNYIDMRVGDIIEGFEEVEVKRTL